MPYLSMFLAPKDNKRTTICYNRFVNKFIHFSF
nr:MAG TPA: hypothetical protein [Caudoviricetes sp.]